MANIASLIDELGSLTGNRPDVNLRARYLREAGIIGRSSKDRSAPQTGSVQVASLLLASLAGGNQTTAATAVRRLWRLLPSSPQDSDDDLTLGRKVEQILEAAASGGLPGEFTNVAGMHDIPVGVISYSDHGVYYGPLSEPLAVLAPIRSMTVVPASAFERLGLLIKHSRDEARRLGIEIPTEQSWRALGFVPPAPATPWAALVELSDPLEPEPGAGNTKAVELPPSTASGSHGNPTSQKARPNDAESRLGSFQDQDSTGSPGARSPTRIGDRTDGQSEPDGGLHAAAA